MLLISEDTKPARPHAYSRLQTPLLHYWTPLHLNSNCTNHFLCASSLSRSFTHQYWGCRAVSIWDVNRLGLIQELHVGTALICKVHKSKCPIQNQCLDFQSFLVSDLSAGCKKKKKVYFRHSQSREKFIQFTEFHNVSELHNYIFICKKRSCLKLINFRQILCLSSGCKNSLDKSFLVLVTEKEMIFLHHKYASYFITTKQ